MDKTKRVTVTELAEMIQRQFNHLGVDVNAGFDRVDNRIDGLEARFDGLDLKMHAGFNSLQNQLDSARIDYTPRREHGLLVERVKRVERKVGISTIQK